MHLFHIIGNWYTENNSARINNTFISSAVCQIAFGVYGRCQQLCLTYWFPYIFSQMDRVFVWGEVKLNTKRKPWCLNTNVRLNVVDQLQCLSWMSHNSTYPAGVAANHYSKARDWIRTLTCALVAIIHHAHNMYLTDIQYSWPNSKRDHEI